MEDTWKILTLNDIRYTNEKGEECIEQWKEVEGYEDSYKVSDLGRIKRTTPHLKPLIRKQYLDKNGYLLIGLKHKTKRVHRLVMTAFKYISVLEVDHKNGIKTDNRFTNLRYCTSRENKHFFFGALKNKSSKFIGVSFSIKMNQWKVTININMISYHLGYYEQEKEAKKVYDLALYLYEKNGTTPNYRNPKKTSDCKGVSWSSVKSKWIAQGTLKGKKFYLGEFLIESEACEKYNNFLNNG